MHHHVLKSYARTYLLDHRHSMGEGPIGDILRQLEMLSPFCQTFEKTDKMVTQGHFWGLTGAAPVL
jgi:hypothetical protein